MRAMASRMASCSGLKAKSMGQADPFIERVPYAYNTGTIRINQNQRGNEGIMLRTAGQSRGRGERASGLVELAQQALALAVHRRHALCLDVSEPSHFLGQAR